MKKRMSGAKLAYQEGGTQDPKVRPGTLRWDPKRWDPRVGTQVILFVEQ